MPAFVRKEDKKTSTGDSSVKIQKKKRKINPATLAIIGIFVCMLVVTGVTIMGNRSVDVITASQSIKKGEKIDGQTAIITIPKEYAESIGALEVADGFAAEDIAKGDIIKKDNSVKDVKDIKEVKALQGTTIKFNTVDVRTKIIEGEVKVLVLNATESKVMSGTIVEKGDIVEFNTIASAAPFMHGEYSVYIYTPDTDVQEIASNFQLATGTNN